MAAVTHERGRVMPSSKAEQVHVSVRVPRDLAAALEEIAAAKDRTVSQEVRRLIRRHVTAFDRSGSESAEAMSPITA